MLHVFSFYFCTINSFWEYCMLPFSTTDPTWNGKETAAFHISLYYKQRNSDSISVGQVLLLCDGKHSHLSIIWLLYMSLSPKLQILIPNTHLGETLFRISYFETSCFVKLKKKKMEKTSNKSYGTLNSSSLETEFDRTFRFRYYQATARRNDVKWE